MTNNPIQSNSATQGSENSPNIFSDIANFLNVSNDLVSAIRSKNIFAGAEPPKANSSQAVFLPTSAENGTDWRVRLSLPTIGTFSTSPIFTPLQNTGNSLVFPVNPAITMNHTANYSEIHPVHSNYSFPQYTNSRTEDITISGEFPVQNEKDGQYWVAAIHFCRSVSKMFYGDTSNKGAPPPILKLNGYGQFVLNNVPVVLVNFMSDMPKDVDYIKTPVFAGNGLEVGLKYNWVPTLSTITLTLRPVYSRTKVSQFSLDKFVQGGHIDEGFI
tara:strand:+ start:789 stop:1604 length:816 start_codon:yes stop_codon:yes gene_type:complete